MFSAFIVRKMQIETSLQYQYIPTSMAKKEIGEYQILVLM